MRVKFFGKFRITRNGTILLHPDDKVKGMVKPGPVVRVRNHNIEVAPGILLVAEGAEIPPENIEVTVHIKQRKNDRADVAAPVVLFTVVVINQFVVETGKGRVIRSLDKLIKKIAAGAEPGRIFNGIVGAFHSNMVELDWLKLLNPENRRSLEPNRHL